MMSMILSKMVSGLTSSVSLSHGTQPMDSAQGSPTAAHSPLVSCFRSIQQNGCVDSDAVHELDLLMNAAGPVSYVDQLVHVR